MDFYNQIKDRFTEWWEGKNSDRPLVKIIGRRWETEMPKPPESFRELHMNPTYLAEKAKALCQDSVFMGEAFPFVDLNMGPGSMAAYLGAEPIFEPDTVWYREKVKNSLDELGKLNFDPDSFWWKEHLSRVQSVAELLQGTGIMATIPDILENVDILSLLRSPQELCYDLIDYPETVEKYIMAIENLYFRYYEDMYRAVCTEDGGCAFTAFSILAPKCCTKVQCDFSALMSPAQFRDFILPSLRRQCQKIPYSLYHLDGVDAVRHLDALMEIKEINAVQWVPGSGKSDASAEEWYPIYDKIHEAGKSLWIGIWGGDLDYYINQSKKLVRRYGSSGLYLTYPELPVKEAEVLFRKAENKFR